MDLLNRLCFHPWLLVLLLLDWPFNMSAQEKKDTKEDAQKDYKERSPAGSFVGEPTIAVSIEEKRLVRKLDMRILPITCLMYLFNCEYSKSADQAYEGN